MADPNNPSDTNELNANTAALNQNTVALNSNTTAAENNSKAIDKQVESDQKHSAIQQILTKAINDKTSAVLANAKANDLADEVSRRGEDIRLRYSKFLENNKDKLMMLPALTLGASQALEKYNSTLNTIGKNETLSGSIDNIKNKLSSIPLAGELFDKVRKSLGAEVPLNNMVKAMDQTNAFKDAIINAGAASGNIGAAFGFLTRDVAQTGAYLGSLSDHFANVSKATGISYNSISDYYMQIQKLPPALENGKNTLNVYGISVGDTANRLDFTTSLLRVAEGSFSSFEDAIGDATAAINNYNASGDDAINFTAQIGKLTSDLGVPITTARNYMRDFSKQMEFVGNNIDASANTFARLYNGFKQTGISAQAASELVSSFTGRIQSLDVAQKAFISAQTGGPGGLRGAFQLEQMLREGKYDEVFEKVRQTMQKQLGGRIVSIEEAGKSEAAASQYQRQISMLRQGPLGEFAKTDREAMRMLEGFSKGFGPGGAREFTKERAITEAAGRGEVLEKSRVNFMSMINAETENLQVKSNIQVGSLLIDKATLAGQELSPLKTFTTEQREAAAREATKTSVVSDVSRAMPLIKEYMPGRGETKLNLAGPVDKGITERIAQVFPKQEIVNEFHKMTETMGSAAKTITDEFKAYTSGLYDKLGKEITEKIGQSKGSAIELELGTVSAVQSVLKTTSLEQTAEKTATATMAAKSKEAETFLAAGAPKSSQNITVHVQGDCPHCRLQFNRTAKTEHGEATTPSPLSLGGLE